MQLQFHSSVPVPPAPAGGKQAQPPELAPAGRVARSAQSAPQGGAGPAAAATRSIALLTTYGELIDSAQVPARDFAAVLRQFHRRAMERLNAVIVLDGVAITRSSFLEFVREFDQSAARSASLAQH